MGSEIGTIDDRVTKAMNASSTTKLSIQQFITATDFKIDPIMVNYFWQVLTKKTIAPIWGLWFFGSLVMTVLKNCYTTTNVVKFKSQVVAKNQGCHMAPLVLKLYRTRRQP